MKSNCKDAQKDARAGGGNNSSAASVEDTAVVSSTPSNAGRLASSPSQANHQHGGGSPSPATSSLEHLWESLCGQGLSDQTTELVLGSWRSKTNKSYDSLFGRWNRRCSERGSNPFSGPVSEVANFLASLYQQGYRYNSLNAYRSNAYRGHQDQQISLT